jgi:hypothetical protein
MPYKKLIDLIVRFKKEYNHTLSKLEVTESLHKVPNKIAGTVGEFYVTQELVKLGHKDLEYKSGQSAFDLFLPSLNKRIEVRSSLLKNEGLYPKGVDFYGWRVQDRSQKVEQKFDVLVCVALPEDFSKPQFYVFTHTEAFKVDDVKIGRFPNVKKKINIFRDHKTFVEAIQSKPEAVTRYERYINRNQPLFLNAWDKLKK